MNEFAAKTARALGYPPLPERGESMTDTHTPGIGDNSGALFDDVAARLDKFLEGAEVWAKRKPEEMNDDLAARANDYLSGARKLWKEADEARKIEKEPHLTASRDVDAKWKRVLDRAMSVADVVKPLLEAFLKAEEAKRKAAAAEAERVRREAEEARQRAEREAAEATSVREKIEAQERAQAAGEKATQAAEIVADASTKAKVTSATGLANNRALRTIYSAAIDSLPQALAHYRDDPKVAELLVQLAERDYRASPTIGGKKQIPIIPGIVWRVEQVV